MAEFFTAAATSRIKAGKAVNMQVVAVPSVQRLMKALPIEPIQFKGSYRNGYLEENSDNGASDLPGQVWGVYFGWVEAIKDRS
ncbi:bifunctional riboflavin kinase/FMN phosphatase-like protein [Tanacetum coccineum]